MLFEYLLKLYQCKTFFSFSIILHKQILPYIFSTIFRDFLISCKYASIMGRLSSRYFLLLDAPMGHACDRQPVSLPGPVHGRPSIYKCVPEIRKISGKSLQFSRSNGQCVLCTNLIFS